MAASIKMVKPLTLKSTMCIKQSRKCVFEFLRRCSSAQSAVEPRKWQLHSAVCLQRFPVVTQEMTDREARFSDLMFRTEIQESQLSDHEQQLKQMREQKTTEPTTVKKPKQKSSEASKKVDTTQVVTALDLEEEWKKHETKFTPASRETEADRTNDMASTQRALSRKLILIVQRQYETGDPLWVLPQLPHSEGESMRQTAERALTSWCGDDVDATFIGNAPCGYYRYKLPLSCDERGVKLFFFKATFNAGNVTKTDSILDYKWVTRDELKDYLVPQYLKPVANLLIDY